MSENKIIITERDGRYELETGALSDFAVIGLLECVLHDLKNARRQNPAEDAPAPEPAPAQSAPAVHTPVEAPPPPPQSAPPEKEEKAAELVAASITPEPGSAEKEIAPAQVAPDLRTRIGNAVKAIRSLGGQIETVDLSAMDEDELQAELEALTNQYKRLKARSGK